MGGWVGWVSVGGWDMIHEAREKETQDTTTHRPSTHPLTPTHNRHPRHLLPPTQTQPQTPTHPPTHPPTQHDTYIGELDDAQHAQVIHRRVRRVLIHDQGDVLHLLGTKPLRHGWGCGRGWVGGWGRRRLGCACPCCPCLSVFFSPRGACSTNTQAPKQQVRNPATITQRACLVVDCVGWGGWVGGWVGGAREKSILGRASHLISMRSAAREPWGRLMRVYPLHFAGRPRPHPRPRACMKSAALIRRAGRGVGGWRSLVCGLHGGSYPKLGFVRLGRLGDLGLLHRSKSLSIFSRALGVPLVLL